MRITRRSINIALVAVLVALINLPFLHSHYTDWRIERNGADVTATVTDSRALDDQYLLQFRYPANIDARERPFIVQVDRATFDRSTTSGTIVVHALRDNPNSFNVDGEVTSPLSLYLLVFADIAIAAAVVLVVRIRPKTRPELVLVATQDLERCKPGSVLERVQGDRYVVAGEVLTIEDDAIVLDLGDRRVRVVLDGHHNPVGYQQPVQATGRMIA